MNRRELTQISPVCRRKCIVFIITSNFLISWAIIVCPTNIQSHVSIINSRYPLTQRRVVVHRCKERSRRRSETVAIRERSQLFGTGDTADGDWLELRDRAWGMRWDCSRVACVKLIKTMERTNTRGNPVEMWGDSRRRGSMEVIAVFLTEDVVVCRRNIVGRRIEIVWQTFSVLLARSRAAGVGKRWRRPLRDAVPGYGPGTDRVSSGSQLGMRSLG